MMPAARALAALAVVCVTPGCGPQTGAEGFASYSGVLACADLVAWGTVTDSVPVGEGLDVTVDVDQWVHPSTGADSVSFLADDPGREVAAPAWPPSDDRILVIVSDSAPTERLDAAPGARAVQQWRDAGSPRSADEECDRA